jgi:2-polyprenyl-3-methyl-5-hydroxy-6-metoxy-1,4-benzoquinol methylase
LGSVFFAGSFFDWFGVVLCSEMVLGQSRRVAFNCLRRLVSTTGVVVEPNETPLKRTSVDPAEIQRFAVMANEWLDENGPMKILHAFNRVRIPWIVDELKKVNLDILRNLTLFQHRTVVVNEREPLKGLKLLDVGSGCGILSFPLTRLGAQVDGLEPSESCVQATDAIKNRLLTEECRKRVNFLPSTVEEHCVRNSEGILFHSYHLLIVVFSL